MLNAFRISKNKLKVFQGPIPRIQRYRSSLAYLFLILVSWSPAVPLSSLLLRSRNPLPLPPLSPLTLYPRDTQKNQKKYESKALSSHLCWMSIINISISLLQIITTTIRFFTHSHSLRSNINFRLLIGTLLLLELICRGGCC